MTMSKHEIERALIELRLSGMAATLETRILQAQASEEPRASASGLWWVVIKICRGCASKVCNSDTDGNIDDVNGLTNAKKMPRQ